MIIINIIDNHNQEKGISCSLNQLQQKSLNELLKTHENNFTLEV